MANLIIALWLTCLLCNLWVTFVEAPILTLRVRIMLLASCLIVGFLKDPTYLAHYLLMYGVAFYLSLAAILFYNFARLKESAAREVNSREMALVRHMIFDGKAKPYQLVYGLSSSALWPLALIYILTNALQYLF